LSNIKSYLEKNFSWPTTLNCSFLDAQTPAGNHLSNSQKSLGVSSAAYFDLHLSGKASAFRSDVMTSSLDEARLGFQNKFSFVNMIAVRSAFDMLLRLVRSKFAFLILYLLFYLLLKFFSLFS
jgi:hypothetical protein